LLCLTSDLWPLTSDSVAVFEAFVLEPEDVEIEFIALEQVFVFVCPPAALRILFRPRGFSFVATCSRFIGVLWIVAGDEVVEVGAFQRILKPASLLIKEQILKSTDLSGRLEMCVVALNFD
jgi:hypothetical protein